MLFRVLGPIEVSDRAGSQVSLAARKLRMLLALLLANAGDRVATGGVIDALWDRRPPRSAIANVQTYVWELRRRLPGTSMGHPRVVRDHTGYRLDVEAGDLDARTFLELTAAGRHALAAGDSALGAATLSEALGLWRGQPYEDVAAVVPQAAQRLLDMRQLAHEDLLLARLQLGEHRDVLDDLRALTAADPLCERPWTLLMLALYRSGRRAEALYAYQSVYRLLDAELGIQPGHTIRELHRRILADDPTLDHETPTHQLAAIAAGVRTAI